VLEAVVAEIERHALGQDAALAAHRDRGCSCPRGAVVHLDDLSGKSAHRVAAPRLKVRRAVKALLKSGRLLRAGGEHGPITLPPERVVELAAELGAATSGSATLAPRV
jgi:hypothetical protein